MNKQESFIHVKTVLDEDFVNYKKASMFIGCCFCDFKCEREAGKRVCQNGALANSPDISISIEGLIDRYLSNSLTEAVVFGGLEPFQEIDSVLSFIKKLRSKGNTDDVVIYTGYAEQELSTDFSFYFEELKKIPGIIIKYGRYLAGQMPHFDSVLGIYLQSANQYAKRIS